jgi:sortase (surface protein transpeptidase)
MNRPRVPYRRVLLPLALALTLAAESIAVVAAVDTRPAAATFSGLSTPFAPQATRPAVRAGGSPIVFHAVTNIWGRGDLTRRAFTPRPAPVEVRTAPIPVPVRPATAAINKAKTESKASKASKSSGSGGSTASSPASYRGRNHMWFPALGINRSVYFFACTSKAYPGNVVYRWGCAGKNNVYLFGHAHSVFKPLHDAYVRGRLKKGMKVMYADGNGKVRTYKIAWWKVTTPDNGAFAFAAQSRPSMTLQTCVGAKSQYRLIVRLVQV